LEEALEKGMTEYFLLEGVFLIEGRFYVVPEKKTVNGGQSKTPWKKKRKKKKERPHHPFKKETFLSLKMREGKERRNVFLGASCLILPTQQEERALTSPKKRKGR